MILFVCPAATGVDGSSADGGDADGDSVEVEQDQVQSEGVQANNSEVQEGLESWEELECWEDFKEADEEVVSGCLVGSVVHVCIGV